MSRTVALFSRSEDGKGEIKRGQGRNIEKIKKM
jgi:hypothetical protein